MSYWIKLFPHKGVAIRYTIAISYNIHSQTETKRDRNGSLK